MANFQCILKYFFGAAHFSNHKILVSFPRFADMLEQADNMAIDIPQIWLYLAELLSPVLKEGGFSMRELFRYQTPSHAHGAHMGEIKGKSVSRKEPLIGSWRLLRTVFCMSCMYTCCRPTCIVLLFCVVVLSPPPVFILLLHRCAHLVPFIKSPHLFQISNQPFPFKESFVV